MAGVWNLLRVIRHCDSDATVDALVAAQPLKYGDLKRIAAEAFANRFADFRDRKRELEANQSFVRATLDRGAAEARVVAAETMIQVRRHVGLDR